ncbi:MAG: carbohydrate ABC transporter permease [Planctomycetota bacterium]|nr:carbohydrate ABC transporter permease [Planctomycetota bacterium]
MPIILPTDKHSLGIKALIAAMYLALVLGGLTMIYPFMITVTSSFSGPMDYYRFSAVPHSFYSRTDRFVRGLSRCLRDVPEGFFRNRPAHWTSWISIGDDVEGIDRFAAAYLRVEKDPAELARWRTIAADYADFTLDYDARDISCWPDFSDCAASLEKEYTAKYRTRNPEKAASMSRGEVRQEALKILREEWGTPYLSFYDVDLTTEKWFPMHHVAWDYPQAGKTEAYQRFKDAYRRMVFRPRAEAQWRAFAAKKGLPKPPWPVTREDKEHWSAFKEFVGQTSPASPAIPFSLKTQWLAFLNRPKTKSDLGVDPTKPFAVADYDRLCGGSYSNLCDIPFPVPAEAVGRLAALWREFQKSYYPRRLIEIKVTPELEKQYQEVFRKNCKGSIRRYNELTGSTCKSFEEIRLGARSWSTQGEASAVLSASSGDDWRRFVDALPPEKLIYHSAEAAYQQYLLAKYKSVEGINAAYGWRLSRIEEASLPFAQAYTITFFNNEWTYYLSDILSSYATVVDYLLLRGRAFFNTVVLCALTILATLTVNPLCAYALSRFRLRISEEILLFLLATMAFPTAVRAIPGFLLLKDLGMLNSFSALILPGLANGMSIFILKGFFDGLPRELYEAAMLDGASEVQMFVTVTLPLTTPILAVSTLGAFLSAYNSWDWALLVCQKEDYWTLAVWLYQMDQTWADYPYIVMAGFVLASIPTAIIFITCQKIILRGIVLPAMK